jgi:hypothetical protein
MYGRHVSWLLTLALTVGCGATPHDDDDATLEPGGDDDSDDDALLAPDGQGVAVDPLHTALVCHDGSGHFETLQEAIDGAADGFTLLICSGSHAGDLTVTGRELTLRSLAGAETTEIVGSGAGPVLRIDGGATLSLEGLSIRGGVSTDGGGGIHCEDSTLEVHGSRLTGNQGALGGGLMASGCQIALEDSELDTNSASYYGGGAYLIDSEGVVSGCLIQGNDAPVGGGLAIEGGDITVSGCEVRNNESTSSDSTAGGGGIWAYGDADFFGNTIADNSSDSYAGGLFALGNGEIADNIISGNFCRKDGGGLYAYSSSSWIHGNQIIDNIADDDAGGLRVKSGSTLIEGNTISFNVAANAGGAAKLSHAANEFLDNVVEGNVSGSVGGGVELDNDNTWISGCTFADNQADDGGGIHSKDSYEEIRIEDSIFSGNVASGQGGALDIEDDDAPVYLTRVRVEGNQAAYGGGVRADDVELIVSTSIFADNTATHEGGGLYIDDVSGWLINTVVDGNSAPAAAGVSLRSLDEFQVVNTIVSANQDSVGVAVNGAAPTIWRHNDVYGNDAGDITGMTDPAGTDGNVSADPGFVDADAGDYQLRSASACVDSGVPELADPDGSRSDIGAFGGPLGSWEPAASSWAARLHMAW